MAYLNTTFFWSGRTRQRLMHCVARVFSGLSMACTALRDNWRAWNSEVGLPIDLLDQECTTVLCFRLSVLINIWTGGTGQMTFSARCFGAKRDAKSVTASIFWSLIVGFIDLSCAMLRGEAYHCETAWTNHNAR